MAHKCSYSTRTYVKARRVLDQYQHMPSFHSIQQDCAAIVGELKTVLKARLDDQKVCMFIPCCWECWEIKTVCIPLLFCCLYHTHVAFLRVHTLLHTCTHTHTHTHTHTVQHSYDSRNSGPPTGVEGATKWPLPTIPSQVSFILVTIATVHVCTAARVWCLMSICFIAVHGDSWNMTWRQ